MAAYAGEGASKHFPTTRLRKLGNGQAAPPPKQPHQSLQMLTFDDTGGDDALGCSPITSRDNAGLIQVGPRHHHLLQVLSKGGGGGIKLPAVSPTGLPGARNPRRHKVAPFWLLACQRLAAKLPSFRKGPLSSATPPTQASQPAFSQALDSAFRQHVRLLGGPKLSGGRTRSSVLLQSALECPRESI